MSPMIKRSISIKYFKYDFLVVGHLSRALEITIAPESKAMTPGIAAPFLAALVVSLLVLPKCQVFPECPFEVAKTAGSIVTVFLFFVTDVVENVRVVDGFDSE